MPKKVIPLEAIPDIGSRIVRRDERDYLLVNDAMFTFYQRSMGELTPFFLALRDERKILGCRCTRCGLVRVPPFETRCPDCDFAPTELVEVGDVGTMLSTPPITYFANSLFQEQVPFGRGRVVLNGADTALSVNFYTTKGILVPGLVKKGSEMKVVFRDDRTGEITDIFCVPASELTPEQMTRKGLLQSELDWESAIEPPLPARTAEARARFDGALTELKAITTAMNSCERARQDIADWQRTIHVKTAGGDLTLRIDNGDLSLQDRLAGHPDFVMVCADPGTLLEGLGYNGSLTQAIMERKLWISKNPEFTTIFKLERMARSLARSKKT
ncbi:MAG: hypothetical protein EPO21_22715 [Chloroflexota bacterium]|nr:MAG: hypothetical protein EPO21_22715 [Chloroflexota bacterium]